MRWSADQQNTVFCASGMVPSRRLFQMKTKSDVVICGQFINCLGLRLNVCCHEIVMWSTRDYLDQSKFCWRSTAILMCQCQAHPCCSQRPGDVDASRLEIREFAILEQSQSQHSWRSFSPRIYRCFNSCREQSHKDGVKQQQQQQQLLRELPSPPWTQSHLSCLQSESRAWAIAYDACG